MINSLITDGLDLNYFTEELINYLRKIVLVKISGASEKYLWDVERNIEEKIIEQAEKFDLNTWNIILKEFVNAFDNLKNDRFNGTCLFKRNQKKHNEKHTYFLRHIISFVF